MIFSHYLYFDSLTTALRSFRVTKVRLLLLVFSEKTEKDSKKKAMANRRHGPLLVGLAAVSGSSGQKKKKKAAESPQLSTSGLWLTASLTLPCSPGPDTLIANTKSSRAWTKQTQEPELGGI